MYPKNNATPPAIDLGQILLLSDGTIQTTGASVRVRIGTGAWGAGAGTLACDTTSGIWTYAPTQAETNADYFIVGVYKADCSALSKTVITSDSSVSGRVNVQTLQTDVITAAAFATSAVDEIVDGVWDEVLTGATHNVPTSAGRRLRQLASVIVHSGTAQGPGAGNNQIQLDAGASSTNGAYDPGLVFIETGTGAGQTRLILQYNGSTKVATVDRDWRVNPDNTSEFVILGDAGRESVNEGLAQAATSTTITLNTNASSSDDAYNGQLVFIRSGTGQDQIALVEDYVGSTKVATIKTRSANGQWSVTPDTTSAYVMIPNLTWTISEIQSGLATSSQAVAIKAVTDKLDTAVVLDGAVYQFTANALELGPSGNATVIVQPLSATQPEAVMGTRIPRAVGDVSPISVDIYDSNDAAVNLTTLGNLEVCVETEANVDLQVVAHANLTISGPSNNKVTWTPNSASVATVAKHRWSLRVASNKKDIAHGVFEVLRVALSDA